MTISILLCGAISLLWLYFDDQRRQRFEASVASATNMAPVAGRAVTLDPIPTLADAEVELLDDDDLLFVDEADDLNEPTVCDVPRPEVVAARPERAPQLAIKPASLPRFSERFGARRAGVRAGDSQTIPGAAYST